MFQGVGVAEKMAEAALAALLYLVSQAGRGFRGGTQGPRARAEGTLATDCLALRERIESKGKRALTPRETCVPVPVPVLVPVPGNAPCRLHNPGEIGAGGTQSLSDQDDVHPGSLCPGD